MDSNCINQLFILCTCWLLVDTSSRYIRKLPEDRLHELEKWPFTQTPPPFNPEDFTKLPFQPWKLPSHLQTTTEKDPQRVLAQMFKAKEINDMREPPKVNKNPLMFETYSREQTTTTTQSPKTTVRRNTTRRIPQPHTKRFPSTKPPLSHTTPPPPPPQITRHTTTHVAKITSKNSEAIIFKDDYDTQSNTFATTPQMELNKTIHAPKINTTAIIANNTSKNKSVDNRASEQETKPQPEPPVDVSTKPLDSLVPVPGTQNQEIGIAQTTNPGEQIVAIPTSNIAQYALIPSNQMTISTSSAVASQTSNQPTLYTIVTVPNTQQILLQNMNTNSVPLQTNSEVKPDQSKGQAVPQMNSNSQQYIIVSSPSQQATALSSSVGNQYVLVQVPSQVSLVQSSSNVPTLVSNQIQGSSNVPMLVSNQVQGSSNVPMLVSNQVQGSSNVPMLVSNQVQGSSNVPMLVNNNQIQDSTSSYVLMQGAQGVSSAMSSNNVPYSNTVMVSING